MATINEKELQDFISENILEYHESVLRGLLSIKLNTVLKKKNPYLFRAKGLESAPELIKVILDAYLSSSEESIFGAFLEKLAVFVCRKKYRGIKSSSPGIDLDFTRNKIRYLVSIKSGPNWGNSDQVKKMRDNFKTAKKIIGTNARIGNVVAVNGCCYGKTTSADKGDHIKLCGQPFWELISGEANFYLLIIEPLGKGARKRNEHFSKEYSKVINKFTREFTERFCDESGAINWELLLEFNSGNNP